ncbi:DNA-(apurinic or apyrimidinic site) lyase [Malassezia cuniculi]|uniref:DNA-(Apurinic or apyrimidinic site) lyase n=1 Tax=Malassezia cuniculi TaxID=948313 RepID=A0AAF0J7T0_9BASI|nr:DNA-(apurinic or apyrimidinic site) lyase [Malassezia cuniculi]
MPPRAQSSTKRAVPEDSEGSKRQRTESTRTRAPKQETPAKASDSDAASESPAAPTGNDHSAPPEIPRNTAVPAKVEFAPRAEDCIRISAWNITSLKSSDQKGFMRYIRAEDADIVVLTETKVNADPAHAGIESIYRYRYWGIGEKKGYAGTAVLSKIKPENVTYGLPGFDDPSSRGRMITLEFPNTVLIGTYAVNAGDNLKTLGNKIKWNDAIEKHIASFAGRDVIWCGDLNVVWDDRDLAGASKKWNKSAGYTQAECDAHRRVLSANKMQDAWRVLHPDAVGHYTYYGWRGMCRSRGSGWRIDSFIVSEDAMPRVKAVEIRHEIYGASDHVPVVRMLTYQMADIAGPL